MFSNYLISTFTNNPLVLQLAVWQLAVLAIIVIGGFIKNKKVWLASYLFIGAGCIYSIFHAINPPQLFDDVVSIIGLGAFAFELLIHFVVHGACVSAKQKNATNPAE